MNSLKSEQPPLPWLTIVGVLLGVLSCVVLAVTLLYLTKTPPFGRPKPTSGVEDLKQTELMKLSRYEWIEKPTDGKAGVVRIPTDRATELYLIEEAGR